MISGVRSMIRQRLEHTFRKWGLQDMTDSPQDFLAMNRKVLILFVKISEAIIIADIYAAKSCN